MDVLRDLKGSRIAIVQAAYPRVTHPDGCPTCGAMVATISGQGLVMMIVYACRSVYRWRAEVATGCWEIALTHLGDDCGLPLPDGAEEAVAS